MDGVGFVLGGGGENEADCWGGEEAVNVSVVILGIIREIDQHHTWRTKRRPFLRWCSSLFSIPNEAIDSIDRMRC